MANTYKILPQFNVQDPTAGPTDAEITALNGNVASRFFYSAYDKDTKFEYKIVYDDDGVTVENENTNENKKQAWYETLLHHWDFCQVLPQGVLTFYNNAGISGNTPIPIKEDTVANIKIHNLSEKPTWKQLYNSYTATQQNNYENATAVNKDAYNNATYVVVTNVDRVGEAEFKKMIDNINSVFGFTIPSFPGNYYYNKIDKEWKNVQ